ncbi:MAG: hypothetical protein ACYSTX_00050 [Planctomycetota bacterium]|jgi:hypothetical protein
MFIDPIPNKPTLEELVDWCQKLQGKILEDDLKGSATWDPGNIVDGNEEATTVTVTGAALGDYAIASFSLDVADLVLDAQVTAANTVTCVLANNTGGAVNLASGTVYIRVFKRTT